MKARLTSSLLIFILLFSVIGTYAAPPRKVPQTRAKRYLIKTNRAVKAAAISIKRGKNYTGDFKRAVLHQRFARKLYKKGRYGRAIAHSRVARLNAFQAIRANKGKVPADANFTAEEKSLEKDSPSDKELEEELKLDLPNDISEEDLINEDLGIDIE